MKKKLIIGIDESTDVDILLDDGIRQFYFGYIPSEFSNTYATQTSLNRRYRLKEQFSNFENIQNVIKKIHSKGGIIYLALNSFTSNEIMLDFSKELYELFFDKVDGIIVANISIAMMLKKRNYKEIIISNLFGTYSNDAVDFLVKQFDPIKIILPRDISLKNIQTIVKSHPNIMFECFLFGDNCRFSESFCFSEHGYDSLTFGSLCSYTQREKKLIKNANPSYKQIVKNTKLTDTEKKEELKKVFLDITSLLDEIEFNLYEFNSKEITLILETLSLYDIAMLKEDKKIYVRAINILKNLDFPKAQSIYTKLKELPFIQEDNYKKFHKLNKSAIYETLNFFAQFNNITSYKIPSRGRDFYKYLDTFENEEYHYKQSQYQL